MAVRESRSERRRSYDDHTRITLLEDDQDIADADLRRIEGKLDGIRNWLVGMALSFATSAVLLGANIAVGLYRR